MKKSIFALVALMAVALTFTSCSKDDDEKKEETKTYTAGIKVKDIIDGDLAAYYHPIASVTITTSKGSTTTEKDLTENDGYIVIKGIETPCTFSYTVTYKKVADFDTTKSYDFEATGLVTVASFVGEDSHALKDVIINSMAGGIAGTDVETYMSQRSENGTIKVSAEGAISE